MLPPQILVVVGASLGAIHGLLVSERGLYVLTEGVLVEAVLPPDLR